MTASPSKAFQLQDLPEFETRFEQILEKCWVREGEQTPRSLRESIRYSLLAPGKRIRPRLLLTTAALLGVPREAAFLAAASIEMLHCFTLIHDDLPCMDNDDFRRGLPTNHKKFGEATALLAGDGLQTLSGEVLLQASTEISSDRVLRALQQLLSASGPRGVIGGQAGESLLTAQSTLNDLRDVHAAKTGALFLASVLIPAALAGLRLDSAEMKTLTRFGKVLGAAFQVVDDLEDAATETTPQASILRFLSPQQARAETLQNLHEAQNAIRGLWQEKGGALCGIAEEVAKRLSQ